jgi:hypothetical protein
MAWEADFWMMMGRKTSACTVRSRSTWTWPSHLFVLDAAEAKDRG